MKSEGSEYESLIADLHADESALELLAGILASDPEKIALYTFS